MHSQGLDSHHGDELHSNEQPMDDDMPTRNALIGWLLAFVLVSFFIFISNLGTIFTFYKKKSLRRRGVYCLINLAVADMIHGFFSMLWFFLYLDYIGIDILPFRLSDEGLKVGAGLVNTCTLVLSLLCLLLVSLDRVYATFYPFAYRSTPLKCYMRVFAATWAASFLLAIIPTFFFEFNIYSHDLWFDKLHFVCIIFLVVIILAYIATFVKIRMQNLSVQDNQVEESVTKRHRQEKHLAITLFIVTMLSLTTWLPFIINHEVDIVSSLPAGPERHYLELLVELIQLTNSLVNPVVYLFRLKGFRRAMFQQFCGKCNSRVQHFDSGEHGFCVRRNVDGIINKSISKSLTQTKDLVVNIAVPKQESIELETVSNQPVSLTITHLNH